jgi:hypothetical protein
VEKKTEFARADEEKAIKLYNDQRNAQVLNLFIYLLVLHVSGFLLDHLQRQVYKFGSGSSLLGLVSEPGRGPYIRET